MATSGSISAEVQFKMVKVWLANDYPVALILFVLVAP